jgi:hypothetical protein
MVGYLLAIIVKGAECGIKGENFRWSGIATAAAKPIAPLSPN